MDDFSGLTFTKKVNDMGDAQFNLPIDSRQLHTLFSDDCIVEIERCVPEFGIDWYVEWEGFHITPQRQITEAGNRFFTSYCRTFEELLHRCWVAYLPQTAQTRVTATPATPTPVMADDAMKKIVRENVGPNIVAGRLIPATAMPNFSVATDLAQADEWKGTFAYRNVLEQLRDMSVAMDVDFAVQRIQRSPVQFLFVTQHPLMGTDHSTGTDLVIFSTEFGNVSQISYTQSATEETTMALVLGEGQQEDRSRSLIVSTRAGASPYARKETIRDARNQDDDGLENDARELIRSSGVQESFVFTALQDSQFVYGRDYFLGDRVILRFEEIERAKRLLSTKITIQEDGTENINFDFGDYIAAPRTDAEVIREITTKLKKVELSGDI